MGGVQMEMTQSDINEDAEVKSLFIFFLFFFRCAYFAANIHLENWAYIE